MKTTNRRDRGFTFVEMIMVLAIISLTMLSVTMIVRSLTLGIQREATSLRTAATARKAVQRLDADIRWTRQLTPEIRSDGTVEFYRLFLFNGDEVCYALRGDGLDRWIQTTDGPKAGMTIAERVREFTLTATGDENAETFRYSLVFLDEGGRRYEAATVPPR